jgi:predicted dehydrogenase
MKIRYGMVGGGEGAFIGNVHRHAAQLDGEYELVCGVFSSSPERSRHSGELLGLAAARCYDDFHSLCAQEASLPAEQRMQCVVIVTPNHLHYPVAAAALQYGFHVLSDKPATLNLAECQQLAALVQHTGLLYGLTHPYVAYPMIREAQALVAAGKLGQVRKVLVEYTQGWLSTAIEDTGQKQASWRLDPAQSGSSCCMGDIGVHAFNLLEFVSGLQITRLRGELNSIVPTRQLDDDGVVSFQLSNGAHGVLIASQICTGDENNLRLRVYGEHGSLDWQQLEPNSLWLRYANQPSELYRTGTGYVSSAARAATRIPAGHPEGYIEAFATLYKDFASQIRAHAQGSRLTTQVPGIAAALRGMTFIETVVTSANEDGRWLTFPTYHESIP